MCGNDYRKSPRGVYHIHPDILEVPMTTRRIRHCRKGTIKHRVKTLLLGDGAWLRPLELSAGALEMLTEKVLKEKDCDHLEFMIHSSELMPGGNPYFKTAEDVEQMFTVMRTYFKYVSSLEIQGTTLQAYVKTV